MATYEGLNIPCVYILMTSKCEALHNLAFNHVKNLRYMHNYAIKTGYMMLDFEKGSRNAMRSAFPEIQIKACYFHFCQCL